MHNDIILIFYKLIFANAFSNPSRKILATFQKDMKFTSIDKKLAFAIDDTVKGRDKCGGTWECSMRYSSVLLLSFDISPKKQGANRFESRQKVNGWDYFPKGYCILRPVGITRTLYPKTELWANFANDFKAKLSWARETLFVFQVSTPVRDNYTLCTNKSNIFL